MGQNRTDYKIHMVRGSLNDVLKRKHTSVARQKKVKRMFRTAPQIVRGVLKIMPIDSDYEFDFGMTITRCHVVKRGE